MTDQPDDAELVRRLRTVANNRRHHAGLATDMWDHVAAGRRYLEDMAADRIEALSKWRSISDAPRDGQRELLVCRPDAEPRTARLMTSVEDGDDAWIIARSVGSRAVAFAYENPTHFREIPTPPSPEPTDER